MNRKAAVVPALAVTNDLASNAIVRWWVLTLCTPALLPNCLLSMQGMQRIFLPLYFFITPPYAHSLFPKYRRLETPSASPASSAKS